jgi:hypothetical protein
MPFFIYYPGDIIKIPEEKLYLYGKDKRIV